MKTKGFSAHLALLGANVIYGLNYTIAKDVMNGYVKPFGFILIRVLFATILFWLVDGLGTREKVARKDLLYMGMCAFFGVALNQLSFFSGLELTSPINASIIMVSTPVLVLLAEWGYFKNQISFRKWVGIGFGLFGAVFLIVLSPLSSVGSSLLGDGLILLNASAYAAYLVLVRRMMKKYEALTVIKWVFTVGLIYVLPFGTSQLLEVDYLHLPKVILFEIAYVVIFTTFLSYLLNMYALKRVRPSTVSVYIYSQPVVSTLTSVSLGKDSLTWIKIVACACIFIGVYLVSLQSRKKLSG